MLILFKESKNEQETATRKEAKMKQILFAAWCILYALADVFVPKDRRWKL